MVEVTTIGSPELVDEEDSITITTTMELYFLISVGVVITFMISAFVIMVWTLIGVHKVMRQVLDLKKEVRNLDLWKGNEKPSTSLGNPNVQPHEELARRYHMYSGSQPNLNTAQSRQSYSNGGYQRHNEIFNDLNY